MALSQNTNLLTTSKITKESLAQLVNNLVLANRCDWSHSEEFGRAAERIGDSIFIRRPFIAEIRQDSMTWGANDPVESKVVLTIDKIMGVDLKFSDADLALRIEDFSKRFISQVMSRLAQSIDVYVYGKVQSSVYNTVGHYGVSATSDTILAAKEILDSYSCPDDGEMYGILTPRQNRSLSNSQLTLFNAQKAISDIYTKGRIGTFAGIDFAWSNSSPVHTDGTFWTGSVASLTVSAQGSSVLTSGWAETSTITAVGGTAGRSLNAGDVFTLSGAAGTVKAYNPWTGAELPFDQQFVVVETIGSTTSAQAIVVSPALIVSGSYKNISGNLNASVSLINYTAGSTTGGQEGLIFNKKAICIGSPDLVVPKGVHEAWRETDDETGAKIRYVNMFDVNYARFVNRLDTFLGVKVARPEWCVKIR